MLYIVVADKSTNAAPIRSDGVVDDALAALEPVPESVKAPELEAGRVVAALVVEAASPEVKPLH